MMNNEPVGYFLYNEEYKEWEETHAGTPNAVPLYTNLAELTDEEIWDFINALCLDMGDYWELTERNAIPMIRAILKKASEK